MSVNLSDFEMNSPSFSVETQKIIKAVETLRKDVHKQVKEWIAQEQEEHSPQVMPELYEHCLNVIHLETNPFRIESLTKKQKEALRASWAGYAEVACRKLAPFVNTHLEYLKRGKNNTGNYSAAMRIQNKIAIIRETFGGTTSAEYIAAMEKRIEVKRAFIAQLKEAVDQEQDAISAIMYLNEHGQEIVSQLLNELYDHVVSAVSRNEGKARQWSDEADGFVIKNNFTEAVLKLPLKPIAKQSKAKTNLVSLRLEYEYRQNADRDNKIAKVNGKEEFISLVLRAFENRLKTNEYPLDTLANAFASLSFGSSSSIESFPYRIEMLLSDVAFPTVTDRFVTVRLQLSIPEVTETSES